MDDLNDEVMDVAFVKAVDFYNYPGGYEGYVVDHRFDEGVSLGDHWRHKYLVDLDGMSYSGRFLAFLESDSAVIKSSVHREFYSDWLQPWYVRSSVPQGSSFSLRRRALRSLGYTIYPSLTLTRKSTTSMRSSPELPKPHYGLRTRRLWNFLRRGDPSTGTGD
jgi:hypothetical protein